MQPASSRGGHRPGVQAAPGVEGRGSASPSSPHCRYDAANNVGRYTAYQYDRRNGKKILGAEPYHPHYCRLLEYVCCITEETNTKKLHDLVEELESSFCD